YCAVAARLLELSRPLLEWVCCSGGGVMSDVCLDCGSARQAALVGRRDGQRMAALPCALVARASSEGAVPVRGSAAAYDFLGARALLEKLVEAGFELHTDRASDLWEFWMTGLAPRKS